MAKRYDVIIVGAGPAGLMAARVAGENGLEVALLEKKTDIPKLTRACLQTLDSANEYLHHDLYRCNARDKRLAFPAHGFSAKYDGPFKNLYAWHIYTPNGYKVQSGDLVQQRKKGDYGKITVVIDKEILLKSMLEEAKDYSVDVFPGINVRKVTSMADGVIVEGSGKSFAGSYVIAADGANSGMAQMMGFNENRYYYFSLHAISYYMSGVEPPDPDVVITTYGFLEEGAALLFMAPLATEGEHNVMVISADPRVDLKVAADYFMKREYCASWFRNAKKVRTLSAVCNAYSPIIEPYKDRVLLVGDVGSTQELEITGAIISGWKAGQAIATAVQEENLGLEITGISHYLDWWKEAYIDYYSHDSYLKSWALPYTLTTEEEIDYVFGLIKEPFAPAFNPYTMPHHLGQALKKVVPTIQKERPELLQKLGTTKLPSSQIFAEVTKVSKPAP